MYHEFALADIATRQTHQLRTHESSGLLAGAQMQFLDTDFALLFLLLGGDGTGR